MPDDATPPRPFGEQREYTARIAIEVFGTEDGRAGSTIDLTVQAESLAQAVEHVQRALQRVVSRERP